MSSETRLIDVRMNDGSRHFAAIPEVVPWTVMRDRLALLAGVMVRDYVSDGVTEAWIDFVYKGYAFSVNTQCGEYWFFVSDPNCPQTILAEMVAHCVRAR